MLLLKGKSVFDGIIFGPMAIYKSAETDTPLYISDNKNELVRFQKARCTAVEKLKVLYKRALISVGKKNAAIFETHQLMLDDLDYIESIESLINEQHYSAQHAINITADKFSCFFKAMDDSYMQARAADITDISAQIQLFLTKQDLVSRTFPTPIILVAKELLPSEIIQLDRKEILGFITSEGSTNSHASILARALGIPAIVAVGDLLANANENENVILDGLTGHVYIAPDSETIAIMTRKTNALETAQKALTFLVGQKNITKSGKKIKIFANIGSTLELEAVLANDADGIGLFRSEFLYLGRSTLPTEEELFLAYKTIIETMKGKPVIIRTLDIGSDKKASYLNLPHEENPALGYRGIRICLTRPDIFKVQLRAILRASAFGNTSIMFPLVNSVNEILAIKTIIQEVKHDLEKENFAFDKEIRLGTMIETPAAAIISDDLAKEVDFFSIGTNDLTQYTLAIDRQNQNLNVFFDPHHKAVLKLIELTVKNAHKNGIPVGICGELGADENLIKTFLNLGLDALSVSPTYILPLRNAVRKLD